MGFQHFIRFDDGERTDYLTEMEAQSLLDDASPLLWHSVMYPWDDFQNSRRTDPRFRSFSDADVAWWLHGQIKQVAQRLCDDCPELGVTPHTTKDNQFYLDVQGKVIVVYKKLVRVYSRKLMRDALVRSNYPTQHNCDFWAQRRESGLDAPRLVLGYEPIKAMSATRIHVGYPRSQGRRFNWVYEMPDQIAAAKRMFNLSGPQTVEAPSEERGFTVESRIGQGEETGT